MFQNKNYSNPSSGLQNVLTAFITLTHRQDVPFQNMLIGCNAFHTMYNVPLADTCFIKVLRIGIIFSEKHTLFFFYSYCCFPDYI